jgi:hypothetical protein
MVITATMPEPPRESLLFNVPTPLEVKVRTTSSHWEAIVTIKHPKMADKQERVKQILQNPLEIRRSKTEPNVYLYYGEDTPYLICIVARHLNGEGFIITAYRTDKMKLGEVVWTR